MSEKPDNARAGSTARKAFPLRLDPALYVQLEAWAQQQMRSVNGQIEWVLREAVKRRERRDEASRESDA